MSYATGSTRPRPHSVHGLGCGCAMPMAGLGILVEPELVVWTPPDVQAWVRTISNQVDSLARDIGEAQSTIEAHADGARFLSDWRNFKARWFRYTHGRSIGELAAAVVDPFANASREYVRSYNALEGRYIAITGRTPTVSSILASGEEANPVRSFNYALMGWAVIGIVGVVGLGYLLSNYAKIQTLSKLAFNRRRRRRSRR